MQPNGLMTSRIAGKQHTSDPIRLGHPVIDLVEGRVQHVVAAGHRCDALQTSLDAILNLLRRSADEGITPGEGTTVCPGHQRDRSIPA